MKGYLTGTWILTEPSGGVHIVGFEEFRQEIVKGQNGSRQLISDKQSHAITVTAEREDDEEGVEFKKDGFKTIHYQMDGFYMLHKQVLVMRNAKKNLHMLWTVLWKSVVVTTQ